MKEAEFAANEPVVSIAEEKFDTFLDSSDLQALTDALQKASASLPENMGLLLNCSIEVWDEDRDKALRRLTKALSEYRISGMKTNIDFLYNLANCAPFRACELDTGFIEKHHAVIFHDSQYEVAKDLPLAALYLVLEQEQQAQARALATNDPSSPWHATNAWRLNEPHLHKFGLIFHEQEYDVAVQQLASGAAARYAITYSSNGVDKTVHALGKLNGNDLHANLDGYQLRASVAEHDGSFSLYTQDSALTFKQAQPDLGEADAGEGEGGLTAPMNGTMVGGG